MDKKTYDALKFLINTLSDSVIADNTSVYQAMEQVERWMDEVAKDYEGLDATEI